MSRNRHQKLHGPVLLQGSNRNMWNLNPSIIFHQSIITCLKDKIFDAREAVIDWTWSLEKVSHFRICTVFLQNHHKKNLIGEKFSWFFIVVQTFRKTRNKRVIKKSFPPFLFSQLWWKKDFFLRPSLQSHPLMRNGMRLRSRVPRKARKAEGFAANTYHYRARI